MQELSQAEPLPRRQHAHQWSIVCPPAGSTGPLTSGSSLGGTCQGRQRYTLPQHFREAGQLQGMLLGAPELANCVVQLRMSPGTPDDARHTQLLIRGQVTRLLHSCLLDAPLPLSHRTQQGKRLACTAGQGMQRSAPHSNCTWQGPVPGLDHTARHSKCGSTPICQHGLQVSCCIRQAITGQHLQASMVLHGIGLGLTQF